MSELNTRKLVAAVLALLGALQFDGSRAWKRYDFDLKEALAAKGWILDPRGRAESVQLTPEALARELFGD